MDTREALRIAFRSLRARKLRSVLTITGIVIGVSAVIVLVGLGDGLRVGFGKTFGELAKAIIVEKVQGSLPGGVTPKKLRDSDVEAVRQAPAVAEVTPLLASTVLMRGADSAEFRGQAFGSTITYLSISNRELERGRSFSIADQQAKNKVVALSPDAVQNLFGGDAQAAVGAEIRIAKTEFTVIGVLRSDGGNSDDIALMPLETASTYLFGGDNEITSMAVKATTVEQVPATTAQINQILDDRHKIQDPDRRDFKVTTLRKQVEQFDQFVGFLTAFTVAVGGISLLVGAIGVANIMLVSVTERTHEIGIRKAIGARQGAILKQFLIESTMLAGLGGLLGVGVGVSLLLVGMQVIPRVGPDFGAPVLSAPPILIAWGLSLTIGLIAGGYPALRAARMRPVEALGYQ